MNATNAFDSDFCTALTVDEPVTLRLPAGSAVFALHGEAWLTQEGLRDDVILAAGNRFNVPSRAQLVVSATRGQARLCVVHPAVARLNASADIYELAEARAADLRRAEFDRLYDFLVRRLRWWRARVGTVLAARPRVPTH